MQQPPVGTVVTFNYCQFDYYYREDRVIQIIPSMNKKIMYVTLYCPNFDYDDTVDTTWGELRQTMLSAKAAGEYRWPTGLEKAFGVYFAKLIGATTVICRTPPDNKNESLQLD